MKKRIAIFAENLYGGGVERILQTILLNFDYEKYDVTLFSSHPEVLRKEFYPTHLELRHYFKNTDGCILNRFYTLIYNKIRLLIYYHCTPSWFYKLFINEQYDVCIAFIEGYATRIVSGAPKECKKIAWLHTDIKENHWTDIAFQNRAEEINCYKQFENVICVSKLVEISIKEITGINNTCVLHNPIDSKKILELSTQRIDLPNSQALRIVTLGSLIEIKGYDRLLKIAKQLNDDGVDFELLILGKGVLRKQFEKYIINNNLGNRVKLLGYKTNPYPYLKAADIYVCSSYAEGFNTSITEALILGRAIVTTDISGVKEQLGEDSEFGIITRNDEEDLYRGLKEMMKPYNIKSYQRKASNRGTTFGLDAQIREIYKIIG